MLSMCEALDSIPSAQKTKNKKPEKSQNYYGWLVNITARMKRYLGSQEPRNTTKTTNLTQEIYWEGKKPGGLLPLLGWETAANWTEYRLIYWVSWEGGGTFQGGDEWNFMSRDWVFLFCRWEQGSEVRAARLFCGWNLLVIRRPQGRGLATSVAPGAYTMAVQLYEYAKTELYSLDRWILKVCALHLKLL